MIDLLHPEELRWLLVAVSTLILAAYGAWARVRTARTLVSPPPIARRAERHRWRETWRVSAVVMAMTSLAIALAMPTWGKRSHDFTRDGRDFLILLDISLSMQARDVEPSRLQSALSGIGQFVETIRREGGHRIGLIVFAGRASPLVPLTSDYDLFMHRLDEVQRTTIRRGSRIGDALHQAMYGVGALANDYTDLILLSDGEDHGSNPADVAQVATRLGITIHSVGIGDPRDGARIPVGDGNGEGFVKVNNTEVVSRMHPGTLVELARITGGEFVSSSAGPAPLADLYERRLATLPRRRLNTNTGEQPVQRFQWFVGAAVGLLILDMMLGAGGRRREMPARRWSMRFHLPIVALIGGLVVYTPPGRALSGELESLIVDGNERFRLGDFHGAAKHYGRALELAPNSALVQSHYATVRFKLYDYGGAIEHFTLALQLADLNHRSAINYNLGVVKHQQAIGNMMTFQDALTPLLTAMAYYRESLTLAPDFRDARYNLELAHRLVQELRDQRVLPQANAQAREQKTSDNQGQAANEPGDKPTSATQEQQADEKQESTLNPAGQPAAMQDRQSAASQSSLVQRGEAKETDVEQAMREVQLARDRADSMAEQRHQHRKARMQAEAVEKFW